MGGFHRIAIVNRGEPAMRLINAVRELREAGEDLCTIALHTAAEGRAMFVREADEAVCLDPPGSPTGAVTPYLDLAALERALVAGRADAAWVGWGFVAERPQFAELCDRLGITFVGPRPEVMRRLGDKIAAKLLAEEAGVPVAPWSGGPVHSLEEAREAAQRIGFPLMIKATAGGGGRGIRLVGEARELEVAFESARSEGLKAFGDATVFLERVVSPARHVEVQVIADERGTAWAVGVRDCSVQRRNQKVIEESCSPGLTDEQERALGEAAVRLVTLAGYTNAGTVEFLYQPADHAFAFLEVNTRLQVEHPVTEVTTGLDLVKLQLLVAGGARLEGDPPRPFGHAIEARLNAEDPQRGFAPSPGRVAAMEIGSGPGIRVDTGIAEGDVIPPEYDSMVAKVIAWGRDRDEARARLRRALAQSTVVIEGGTTNKAFLLQLLERPELVQGDYDTGWLDRLTTAPSTSSTQTDRYGAEALIVAAIDAYDEAADIDRARFLGSAARGRPQASQDLGQVTNLQSGGTSYRLHVARGGPDGWYRVSLDDQRIDVVLDRLGRSRSRLTVGGHTSKVLSTVHGSDHAVEVEGEAHRFSRDDGGLVRAPAAAVVLGVLVEPGETVEQGRRVALLEAMKMEVGIAAPVAGRVAEVLVAANMQVDAGTPLVRLEPTAPTGADEGAPPVRLDGLSSSAEGELSEQARSLLHALRATVLGYDLGSQEAAEVLTRYETIRRQAGLGDAVLAGAELGILDAFADLSSLARDRRQGETDEGELRSSREWFNVYLRSLDADREGLPDGFRERLSRALQHYGVGGLERSPELEEALYRIFQAQQRRPAHVPVIRSLLEHLLTDDPTQVLPAEELRSTLDRLITATLLRHPQLGDLARSVRFRWFDQPVIEQAREATFAEMRDHLTHLRTEPNAPDVPARMDRLVSCGQPLLRLLGDDTDAAGATGDPLVEVLTRRYYKIRPLRDVRTQQVAGHSVLRGAYDRGDRRVQVVALRTSAAGLDFALAAVAEAVAVQPGPVVVDLYARGIL